MSRHCAAVVLGKAMTSRMEGDPLSSMASRSRPSARPPCGGAPSCRHAYKQAEGGVYVREHVVV